MYLKFKRLKLLIPSCTLSFTEIVGPYLHINQIDSIGEDFRDEFTILSSEGYHTKKFSQEIEAGVHHTHGKEFQ